jgi:CheY-like chemotaxis protein
VPLRILLADDSMTAQNMAKKILTDAGHEVTAVSNGAAAAKKISDKFDVIILDVYMPGYSGLEICEKVRASMDTAKTPVLLTVGKMEPYNPQDGQKVKADGVIVKPFEASDLLAAVQKLDQKAKAALAAAPKEKPNFEKTMVFKAPNFQDETYHDWKADAPGHKNEEEEQEMPVEAAPPPMPVSEPGVPAFAMDDSASMAATAAAPAFEMPSPAAFEMPTESPAFEMPTSAAPAFDMDAAPSSSTVNIAPPAPATPSLDDTMQFPAATPSFSMDFAVPTVEAIAEAPAFSIPGMDEVTASATPASAEAPSVAEMLEPTSAAPVEIPINAAPAPDVEFTAAPRVGDIAVTIDPSLDTHEEGAPSGVIAMTGPDPALVTDPHEMAQEFTTKFGVENDTDPVVVGTVLTPEQIAEVAPDTEAAAPMEEAATPAEMSEGEEVPASARETQEMEAAADEPSVEAPVEVAETVEAAQETVPEEVVETQELEAREAEPSAVEPEAPAQPEISESQEPPAGMLDAAEQERASSEVAIAASEEPPAEMLDAAMVEQIQAAVAGMQLQEHPVEDQLGADEAATPVAIEEVPAVAEPAVEPDHDVELASALAASLGAEPMAQAAAAGAGSTTTVNPATDPTVVSAVVNKVLERMLPLVLSQIAAEMENLNKK